MLSVLCKSMSLSAKDLDLLLLMHTDVYFTLIPWLNFVYVLYMG